MATRLTAHLSKGAASLPPVPITEQLSERVFVALGMNPSPYSLRGTNTYLVGLGQKRILIDTGDADFVEQYMPVLKRAVADSGAMGIEQIVLTHWHRDHIGGVQAILDHFGRDIPVRRFVPPKADDALDGEGGVDIEQALLGAKVVPLGHGDTVKTEGATLRAIHTPGHANDHLVLMLEEEEAMFTGDNVLGTGTPVFRNLPQYLDSLRVMKAEHPSSLYTSHGPVVRDGEALIEEYIQHRMVRVNQVRGVLEAAAVPMDAEEITRAIYTTHPEHLVLAAIGNTAQALRVLQNDGIVDPTTKSNEDSMAIGTAKWCVVSRM